MTVSVVLSYVNQLGNQSGGGTSHGSAFFEVIYEEKSKYEINK